MTARCPPISLDLARRIMQLRPPDEVINRNGDPLFERWWLARTPSDATTGPRGNVYLHRWLRSDREDAHDHPWINETFVLRGWLVEELFCPHRMSLYASGRAQPIRRRLLAGMSAMREADAIHRIVAIAPGTITLFLTRAKVRDWGFWEGGSFVPWRDYHGLPAETPASFRAGVTNGL